MAWTVPGRSGRVERANVAGFLDPGHKGKVGLSRMRVAVKLSLLLSLSSPATASPCDILVTDIINTTGAEFSRESPSRRNVFFKHPYINELSVDCSSYQRRAVVHGYWTENAFPPKQFYAAMAAVGALVTPETAARIEPALPRCVRTALAQSHSELARDAAGDAAIGCHAFSRDGGSASVRIGKRK